MLPYCVCLKMGVVFKTFSHFSLSPFTGKARQMVNETFILKFSYFVVFFLFCLIYHLNLFVRCMT